VLNLKLIMIGLCGAVHFDGYDWNWMEGTAEETYGIVLLVWLDLRGCGH